MKIKRIVVAYGAQRVDIIEVGDFGDFGLLGLSGTVSQIVQRGREHVYYEVTYADGNLMSEVNSRFVVQVDYER